MNSATSILLALSVCTPAFGQPKPSPKEKPWLLMDRGPFFSASIESPVPTRNVTQKAIAIRLTPPPATRPAYVLFDEDLLRYSLAWIAAPSGPIDWRGVALDGTHRVWPAATGEILYGNPLTPGWAHDGSFADSRPRFASTDYKPEPPDWRNRPYGPLPRDHGQFKGIYLHGQRVVLSYDIDGVSILDSPGYEPPDRFTRTLRIGRSARDLTVQVLQLPSRGTHTVPASARNSVVLLAGDQPLAVAAVGATDGMTWQVTADAALRLHVPAADTPADLKLLVARSHEGFKSSPAPGDLSALIHGGPPRYPQVLTTAGTRGSLTGPYAIDNLTAPADNPWHSRMRFGGFDFFQDGTRAAVCTWDGDVFLVSGIDDTLSHLTWRRIATGLYQPLGLKILPAADGKEEILVCCRDQIARLHDFNGDGEIDFIECVNSDHQVTEHFHEFAMDLQTDEQGNFYYAKAARHALPAVVPQHGTILKVSKDGTRTEILATGLRAPNGIGLGPNNEIVTSDQEGYWMPANRLNLWHVGDPPPFFGNLWAYSGKDRTPGEGYAPPLCWLPTKLDRSPAEQLWVANHKWGLPAGAMIHTSYGTGQLFLVLYEWIDGMPQGGVVPLPGLRFPTGIMRARFNPNDGQLYTCGLVGWSSDTSQPGGFFRVRYTGRPLRLPTALHVKKEALTLTFTDALDKSTAEDPARYAVEQWQYRWTEKYGSPHYRVSNPDEQGHDEVEIESAALSPDGKTITLHIPRLKPVMQMQIQLNVKSADGAPIKLTIHNTINKVPDS